MSQRARKPGGNNSQFKQNPILEHGIGLQA